MRVLLLVPLAVLPADTLLKVAKLERDGVARTDTHTQEDEIQSKKRTPAITYVCAAVFVPLISFDHVYPSQGSKAE